MNKWDYDLIALLFQLTDLNYTHQI